MNASSGVVIAVEAADRSWQDVVGRRFEAVLAVASRDRLPDLPGLVTADLVELGVQVGGQVRTLEAVVRRGRRGLKVTGRDVTDERRCRRDLAERAATDPLTGLANRSVLDLAIESASARAARSGTLFAVAVIDIDGLKAINDDHGHCAGDAAIVAAAAALNAAKRGGDTLLRFGGDEFVLVATELLASAEAETIAARLVRAVAASDAGVTVSVGVAVAEPGGPEDLVDLADVAMYDAKARGGDRHHLAAHDSCLDTGVTLTRRSS